MGILTDKAAYIQGDALWYAVYIGDGAPQSGIIHVEVWQPGQGRVLHHQLALDGRMAKGFVPIPPEWTGGIYTLRATSFWNFNFGEKAVAEVAFSILEDEQGMVPPSTYTPGESEFSQSITLETDSVWATRSTQKMTISLPEDLHGQYSVRVLAASYAQGSPFDLAAQWEGFSSLKTEDPPSYSPQKALRISGYAIDPQSNKPLVSSYLARWSVDSASYAFLTCLNGEFDWEWPAYPGEQTFQIYDFAPLHDKRPQVSLSFDAPPFSAPARKFAASSSPSSNYTKPYYREQWRNLRMDQLFSVEPYRKVLPASSELVSPWEADRRYFAEKYIRFEFLEGFFREGAPYINVVEKKGQRSLKMDNFETKLVFEESPLFLVDHYIHFGDQEILKFPWERIQYIDQYYFLETLREEFGLLGRYGAISIYTLNGQTPEKFTQNANTFVLEGLHVAPEFSSYKGDRSATRTPNMDPLLFWGHFMGSGKQSFEVSVGDRRGAYLVEIQGVSSDGAPLSLSRRIVVE